MRLNNKIILITGASSGIGEACARLIAQEGGKLILVARRKERLDALVKELAQINSTECLPYCLDIRDNKAIEEFIKNLPTPWQSIDVLINNAGTALSTDPIQQGELSNWETMIDTNIKGLLYISRQILPIMLQHKQGHVVNIGSIAGQDCYLNGNVYSATKHAVRALSKSMRLDLAGSGIRVTEIAPGAVETEFSIVRWNDKERAKAFYEDFNPLFAADVADAVLYSITRPAHVDIAEITIMPTDQAACSVISRNGRKKENA